MKADSKELRVRRESGIRPLQDTVLDAILDAIDRAGNMNRACIALDITKPTIIKRLRGGYHNGQPVRRLIPKGQIGEQRMERVIPQKEGEVSDIVSGKYGCLIAPTCCILFAEENFTACWIIGLLGIILMIVYAGLSYYENKHRMPCSLCNDIGTSEDGIPCVFCTGRR